MSLMMRMGKSSGAGMSSHSWPTSSPVGRMCQTFPAWFFAIKDLSAFASAIDEGVRNDNLEQRIRPVLLKNEVRDDVLALIIKFWFRIWFIRSLSGNRKPRFVVHRRRRVRHGYRLITKT